MPDTTCLPSRRIRFDLREFSGAFGDLGTDLPLLAGVVLASGMDGGWVFLLFGLMQIATALIYGIPMPNQPLKAVAALVIVQRIDSTVIAGGALAIGLIMLLLTLSGSVGLLARLIPKPVIRGIQIGLGIKLALLATGSYVSSQGVGGMLLAGVCMLILLYSFRCKRFPAALAIVVMGATYAVARGANLGTLGDFGISVPIPVLPSLDDLWLGLIVLAIPQLPLSIGNSVLATRDLAEDWFPERRITLRKIGTSYSLFNLVAALWGGVPVCHGSGGMAGHYAFGGRTGGSVVIYGLFYVALGVASALGFHNITALFPLPALGVILLVEGITLIGRGRDLSGRRFDWWLAVTVGLCAAFLPNGFLIAMIGGALAAALRTRALLVFNLNEERHQP